MIDHTALKPDTTKSEILTLCNEAVQNEFATVCVNPYWVKLAAGELADSSVGITTVIGFPLGATTTSTKVFETAEAIKNGATEIDMVINVGELKKSHYDEVLFDISEVKKATPNNILKVILETCLLTSDEIKNGCELCVEAGANFVKTSTGFSSGGATIDAIKLMRDSVGPDIGVKASGGIRTTEDAIAMIEAGANRIGASASIEIIS